jgi:uncharacterized protein YgfB (UPF0149 family)
VILPLQSGFLKHLTGRMVTGFDDCVWQALAADFGLQPPAAAKWV